MFDLNIHLPCGSDDLDGRWCDEGTMGGAELIHCFEHHLPTLKETVTAGNFMLFNESLTPDELSEFTAKVNNYLPGSRFTMLGKFRESSSAKRLQELKYAGLDAVKFHCYFQKIAETDFDSVLELSKSAADIDMPIMIDTSYGSTGMYKYDNLKLATYLLEEINSVPIVLLHSGGARVLEAFLLADACPNVYLETSFSLPYYIGSSVEQDLAFAYKKVKDKVIYGSDFPYVDMDTSMNTFLNFMREWQFTENEIEAFLSTNYKQIFSD